MKGRQLIFQSYRWFGKRVKKYRHLIKDIATDLQKAEISLTVEEYFSLAVLFSIIGFILSFISLSAVFVILTKNLPISLVFSFFVGSFLTLLIFSLFYFYPSQVAASRKKKVDNGIHFAAIYMSTLAGTGLPTYKIFKIIGSFEEFGEIARIFQKVWYAIDRYGMDISEALARAAESSPSEGLKELLWGMRTTMSTGADLKRFLIQKGDDFIIDYRRKLQEYVKTLSIFMEMYITAVIVGSVFILVLTTIMSLLGGYAQQLQTVQMILVTIGLPFLSAAFILMLKIISPTET